MAQSLSKIYVHLIFSTKDRERSLPDELRPDLHAYMGGTLKGLGCSPIEINSESEQQTARDSTKGPELPMGERRAVKADSLAS